MKKAYIIPSVEAVKVETSAIIAASMKISTTTVDTSVDGIQLVRDNDMTPDEYESDMWDEE